MYRGKACQEIVILQESDNKTLARIFNHVTADFGHIFTPDRVSYGSVHLKNGLDLRIHNLFSALCIHEGLYICMYYFIFLYFIHNFVASGYY